jgi:oligosaccharyltransferase complex subunit gamma
MLFTSLLFLLVAGDSGVAFVGRTKAKKMQMMANDNQGLIPFNAKSFQEFILSEGRSYFAVVLFLPNVTHEKCHLCKEVQETHAEIAQVFRRNSCEQTGLNSLGQGMRPVFFGVIHAAEETKQLFKMFSVGLLAQIIVIPKDGLEFKGNKWRVNRHNIWEIVPGTEFNLQKLISFVNIRTGREVQYSQSTQRKMEKIGGILMIFTAALVMIYFFYDLILKPVVWFVFTLFAYFLCISGFVFVKYYQYSWIGYDSEGRTEYVSREYEKQYELEGYLVSALMCSGGLLLVVLNYLPELPTQKRWVSWIVRGVSLGLLYALWQVCNQSTLLYKLKWNYYNPTFAPPRGYIQGPLNVDQGTSF